MYVAYNKELRITSAFVALRRQLLYHMYGSGGTIYCITIAIDASIKL